MPGIVSLAGNASRYFAAALGENLVQFSDFKYLGNFDMPQWGSDIIHTDATSTTQTGPLALGPGNTILWSGNTQAAYVYLFDIPAILGTATVAVEPGDVGTNIGGGTSGEYIGKARGGFWDAANSRWVVSLAAGYDADNICTYSQVTIDGNLENKEGPYRIKWLADATYGANGISPANAFFNAGRMGEIPSNWQVALGGKQITAQGMASINTRTPWGLAIYATDISVLGSGTIGELGDPAPATPLCVMPLWAPGDVNMQVTDTACDTFQVTDICGGVAFPANKDSILVFGLHGFGGYGYGTGTTDQSKAPKWPSLGPPNPHEPIGNFFYQYDENFGDEGTHAWWYRYVVWAFRASDAAAVAAGSMLPQDIRPYAMWVFDDIPAAPGWMGGNYSSIGNEVRSSFSTFDPATGKLYFSDASNKCHVFTIAV